MTAVFQVLNLTNFRAVSHEKPNNNYRHSLSINWLDILFLFHADSVSESSTLLQGEQVSDDGTLYEFVG